VLSIAAQYSGHERTTCKERITRNASPPPPPPPPPPRPPPSPPPPPLSPSLFPLSPPYLSPFSLPSCISLSFPPSPSFSLSLTLSLSTSCQLSSKRLHSGTVSSTKRVHPSSSASSSSSLPAERLVGGGQRCPSPFGLYTILPSPTHCMVCGIKRRGRWGSVYCAMVVP